MQKLPKLSLGNKPLTQEEIYEVNMNMGTNTKTLIYQIGRFDKNFNNPLKFKIKEKIYEKPLSSFALKEHLNSQKDTKLVLIYPISLLLNPIAKELKLPLSFKEKLLKLLESSEEKEEYLKNPAEYFKLHPHSEFANDFLVIHSVGEYEGIEFSATFDDLVLEILFDMISRYLDKPFTELYLDISSGHNIYVSALIEAGRLFLTFYKLQNFLPQEDQLKVYIIFSDPILPPYERIFKIHDGFPLDVKVFFAYPERPEQFAFESAFSSFIKKLEIEDSSIKRQLNNLFSKGYFFYSAIKNNTPLVLYTWEYHKEEEIIKGIKYLINFINSKLFQNYQKTPNINFESFRKAFLMLAIYLGIVKVLKFYEIKKKSEVSISELNKKFRDEENTIYKYFNLIQNRTYFGHEISNNFEKAEIKEKFQPEWKLLQEFVSGESKDIQPRNFFAHCGFERNCVEVKREGKEILLRYKSEILKKIENFILKN